MSIALPNGCLVMVGPVHALAECVLAVCAGAWAAPSTPMAAAPTTATAANRVAGTRNQRADALRMKGSLRWVGHGIKRTHRLLLALTFRKSSPLGQKHRMAPSIPTHCVTHHTPIPPQSPLHYTLFHPHLQTHQHQPPNPPPPPPPTPHP